jgi:hypothetical protein
MKRLIIALAVGGAIFAATLGLAASLNVSSGTLGAGTDTVAACQTNPVGVNYTPTFAASYEATSVDLSGLEATCNGKSFKVTLTGAGGSLGEATGTLPASGTTHSESFSGVSAEAVTGVHVTIYG